MNLSYKEVDPNANETCQKPGGVGRKTTLFPVQDTQTTAKAPAVFPKSGTNPHFPLFNLPGTCPFGFTSQWTVVFLFLQ